MNGQQPDHKLSNDGCDHHACTYRDDSFDDDARIRSHDDDKYCPNDAGRGRSGLRPGRRGLVAFPIARLSCLLKP